MKLGIFTALFGDWPLAKVAAYVSGLGYEAVELPVWAGNTHLVLEEVLAGKGKQVKRLLADNGLMISAICHGLAGQLSMGPLDSSTDAWAPGMSPEQKVAYAVEQLKMSARAASELEVPVVTGLIGSHVWDKWYIFPRQREALRGGVPPVRRALEPHTGRVQEVRGHVGTGGAPDGDRLQHRDGPEGVGRAGQPARVRV